MMMMMMVHDDDDIDDGQLNQLVTISSCLIKIIILRAKIFQGTTIVQIKHCRSIR